MVVRTKISEEGRENRNIRTQEAKKAKEELLKKRRTLDSTNFYGLFVRMSYILGPQQIFFIYFLCENEF